MMAWWYRVLCLLGRHGEPVMIWQEPQSIPGVICVRVGNFGCARCGAYMDPPAPTPEAQTGGSDDA